MELFLPLVHVCTGIYSTVINPLRDADRTHDLFCSPPSPFFGPLSHFHWVQPCEDGDTRARSAGEVETPPLLPSKCGEGESDFDIGYRHFVINIMVHTDFAANPQMERTTADEYVSTGLPPLLLSSDAAMRGLGYMHKVSRENYDSSSSSFKERRGRE